MAVYPLVRDVDTAPNTDDLDQAATAASDLQIAQWRTDGSRWNMVNPGVISGRFATRAALVSAISAAWLTVTNGELYLAGGLLYQGSTGATDISDLPGLVPDPSFVTPNHFGDNTTPGTTDMTAAFQAAIDYATSYFTGISGAAYPLGLQGLPINLLPGRYVLTNTLENTNAKNHWGFVAAERGQTVIIWQHTGGGNVPMIDLADDGENFYFLNIRTYVDPATYDLPSCWIKSDSFIDHGFSIEGSYFWEAEDAIISYGGAVNANLSGARFEGTNNTLLKLTDDGLSDTVNRHIKLDRWTVHSRTSGLTMASLIDITSNSGSVDQYVIVVGEAHIELESDAINASNFDFVVLRGTANQSPFCTVIFEGGGYQDNGSAYPGAVSIVNSLTTANCHVSIEARNFRFQALDNLVRGAVRSANWPAGTLFENRICSFKWSSLPTVMLGLDRFQVNVRDFGAYGDGTTDDTTAIATARAVAESTGGELLFPAPYTYLSDPIVSAAALKVRIAAGATVKLKSSATGVTVGGLTSLAVFVFGHSNCEIICDGVIDGNRDNQDKAGFLSAGGSDVRRFHGVIAYGTSEPAPITSLKLKLNVINTGDDALLTRYCNYFHVESLDADDCGGLWDRQDCYHFTGGPIRGKTIDHDGWYIQPHLDDLFRCNYFDVGPISVSDHAGSGTTGTSTTLSEWVSGVTAVGCRYGKIRLGLMYWREDDALQKSLAQSYLGNVGVEVVGGIIIGYTDNGLEWRANDRSNVTDQFIEGRYRQTSLSADEQGIGVAIGQGAFALEEDENVLLGRAVSASTNCKFERVKVRGWLSHAWAVASCEGVDIIDCEGDASYGGLFIDKTGGVTDSFPNSIEQGIRKLRIRGGSYSYNEAHGIWGVDGIDVEIKGIRTINNGQGANHPDGRRKDGTSITAGDGIHTTAGENKTSWRVYDNESWDDQTATSSKVSYNPDEANVIYLSNPKLWRQGQCLTITGVGVAGADLTTMIDRIEQDKAWLRDDMSTFPTVAGTGTLSSSSRTLTGSGTDLDDELNYRAIILADGQARQITTATTNTAASTSPAFSPALSGDTFAIYESTADQIQSQRYGFNPAATLISPVVSDMKYGVGNVTANVSDNTAASTPAIFRDTGASYNVLPAPTLASALTGSTSETTLATITLPKNSLGRYGVARITIEASYTNNANNKTLRTKFGGTTMDTIVTTTSASLVHQITIRNAGSVSSQRGAPSLAGGLGVSASAFATATVDTSADVTILITGQLANAGDTLTLLSAQVEVLHRG